MQVFVRSKKELVKGVFYSLGGGLVGLVVAGVAGWPTAVLIGLPVACVLALAWLLVLGENIRVEVHDGGRLDFYRMGKLKNSFDMNHCGISLSARGKKVPVLSLQDMSVNFTDQESGKSTRLDFAPLGKEEFSRLRQSLRCFTG